MSVESEEARKAYFFSETREANWVELRRAQNAYSALNEEVCQILGKALGYPWFKDDQKNFPGATEVHGVCVGDHVAGSLADEAAHRIKQLESSLETADLGEYA